LGPERLGSAGRFSRTGDWKEERFVPPPSFFLNSVILKLHMAPHLSRPELVRLLSGEAVQTEVDDMVPHLIACRPCWELAAGVVAELKKDKALVRSGDKRAAILTLLEDEERAALDLLKARACWAELRDLSPEEQIEKIHSVAALRTRTMFEVVLAEARAVAPRDPFLGEETARVAYLLAGSLPSPRYPETLKSDLQAEAMNAVANARRLAADWKSARAALAASRNLLSRGSGNPAREARFLSKWASLATDTGDFEVALGLLGRAAELYRSARDPAGLSTMAVQEASTLLAACRHEEAVARAREALTLLAPGEARLEMLARSIITECLVYLGRSSEALRSFVATRPLYEQFWGRRTELDVGSLEALLLDSLGCVRESKKAFRKVIAGYIEEELYKDAFLTLLTFFEILVKRGAFRKAKQIYQQAADLLAQAGSGSHEQMRQVWRHLLQQMERESLKEDLLQEVRQYVYRHWNTPAPRPPFAAIH
jgi:tetratricopeptide (TPR) repeat protein